MKRFWYAILMLTSCSDGSQPFESGKVLSVVKEKALKEASGLEASTRNAGWLWTLTDSGNEPEVYLINEELEIKLTCRLTGVKNRDWEDITIGPGPDPAKSYVYVGDIGDNEAVYPYKYIYRFEEPEFREGTTATVSVSPEILTFRLSDKIKDTESLFINPATQQLYLISKRESPVHVYELSNTFSGDTLTAESIAALPYTKIVAADYDPSQGLLMKDYDHIYYWEVPDATPFLALLQQPPVKVKYEQEPQGESIAWATDGSAFYTLSESKKRSMAKLYRYDRKAKPR